MHTTLKKRLLSLGYVTYEQLNKNEVCQEEEIGRLALSFLSLGFQLDSKSLDVLRTMTTEALQGFYHKTISLLREIKGADLNHVVFYKNFPQNEGMDSFEIYVRAILHYLTASKEQQGFMSDDIKEIERLPYVSNQKPVTISLLSEDRGIEMLKSYYTGMLEAPKAIPDAVLEEMKIFVDDHDDLAPSAIPFHANVASFIYVYIDGREDIGKAFADVDLSFVHTATDVLRIYAVLSKGDVTLQERVIFVSMPRSIRKKLLSKLNDIALHSNSIVDDLHMHIEVWKRAFEFLHPGEFAKKYPYIFRVATNLRNKNYVTYMARVEACIKACDTPELVKLLAIKPGVFLRMIDALIRNPQLDKDMVINAFGNVAEKISVPARISLWEYYKNRENVTENRFFVYRYGHSFVNHVEEEKRPMVEEETRNKIIEILEVSLKNSFKNLPRKEKVYISPVMKGYTLPSNNLGASSGFHTLPMYSRVKLDGEHLDYLRFFTYWKNMVDDEDEVVLAQCNGRVDIDLSLEMFDESLKHVKTLSWRTLCYSNTDGTVHSGDVVTAPKGASEFVDLEVAKVRKYARYALIANSVFTGQSFMEIPMCSSGVMAREGLGTQGELFEPKDVIHCYKLTSKGCNMNFGCLVDLETLELIWLDIPFHYGYTCGVAEEEDLEAYMRKALNTHMSIYDLVMLHKDHLSFVETREEAEFVIDIDEQADINPYNIPGVISEWL